MADTGFRKEEGLCNCKVLKCRPFVHTRTTFFPRYKVWGSPKKGGGQSLWIAHRLSGVPGLVRRVPMSRVWRRVPRQREAGDGTHMSHLLVCTYDLSIQLLISVFTLSVHRVLTYL